MSELKQIGQENGADVDPLEWKIMGADNAEERGYWDLCIVFDGLEKPKKEKAAAAWEEKKKERAEVLLRLKAAGLLMRRHVSLDGKEHYYLVSALQDRLELQAELMELEMRMQPKFGGGYAPFTRKNKHIFLRAFDDEFFTRTQRQHIVRTIVEADHYSGGAGRSIHNLLKRGIFAKCYPLHDKRTRAYLSDKWAHWHVTRWWQPQPLAHLRDYFGEELTLYFAWLGYYNKTLVIPSLLGIGVFVLQFVPGTDGWPNFLFSLFMMIWTTLFLEFWKRKQNILAFQWNMTDFESSEASRPDYNGTEALGVFSMGQWVPFSPDDPALQTVHVVPTAHYPKKKTKFKLMTSFVPLMGSLILVVFIVIVVLGVRLTLQKLVDGFWGGIIGSVIGAVLIIIFNVIYKKMAVKLNDWENHRTQTEYDDNLIIKTILFQFVNTMTSLYYIAFFKSGFDYFGVGGSNRVTSELLFDACKTVLSWEDEASGDVIGTGCISELGIQAMTLMVTNLVIGQTKEILLPMVMVRARSMLAKRKAKKNPEAAEALAAEEAMDPWEKQSKLVPFEGTFDEYAEMAIQFGLVTVFAAAVPAAPFLALLNNVIEIRTDAIKILNTNQKPWYKGAQDIGGWYQILDVISVISVVTNAMLSGLGYAAVPKFVGTGKLGTSFNTIIFCVALEHLTFILKFVLAEAVPDMPSIVQQQLARQEFLKEQVLAGLEEKPQFSIEADEKAVEAFDYVSTFAPGTLIKPDPLAIVYGLDEKEMM